MEVKELTCIGCPMGCQLAVSLDGNKIESIRGNTCKIGFDYAAKEVTAPRRIVTSTVRVLGGIPEIISVKTKGDIPKEQIFEAMAEIKKVPVSPPVLIGDIIVSNICGTGIDVVATKESRRRKE